MIDMTLVTSMNGEALTRTTRAAWMAKERSAALAALFLVGIGVDDATSIVHGSKRLTGSAGAWKLAGDHARMPTDRPRRRYRTREQIIARDVQGPRPKTPAALAEGDSSGSPEEAESVE